VKPIRRVDGGRWAASGSPPVLTHLETALAVAIDEAVDARTCRRWARAVLAARSDWVADFGSEQFALGRAFYTHFETGRSALYFRDAAKSDARVERHLPGMQAAASDLLARLVGGNIRRRYGFCGPGVHVFPAGEKVAKNGGVIHFDVEGLTPLQLSQHHRALSLVVMLQPAAWGGGLRIWDVLHSGSEEPTDEEVGSGHVTFRYDVGSALLMDSRRLHQIRPFRGKRHRISITVHAAEVDRGVWEAWF
jgi:hypothetical protein